MENKKTVSNEFEDSFDY